jgi:hypothetical protein
MSKGIREAAGHPTPGTAARPPLFHFATKPPSTLVLLKFESFLYPPFYCSLARSRIHFAFD